MSGHHGWADRTRALCGVTHLFDHHDVVSATVSARQLNIITDGVVGALGLAAALGVDGERTHLNGAHGPVVTIRGTHDGTALTIQGWPHVDGAA